MLVKRSKAEHLYNDYLKNQYNNLQQENKQLKHNWDKLKSFAKSQSDLKHILGDNRVYFEIDELLNKMLELEKGDSNGKI